MWRHALAWSLACAMAAVGAGIVALAMLPTRGVGLLTTGGGGFVRVSPRHVELAVWTEYLWPPDWLGSRWSTAAHRGTWTVLTRYGSEQAWLFTIEHEAQRSATIGGFGYFHGLRDLFVVPSFVEVIAPTWIAVTIAVCPLAWLGMRRWRRRPRPGRCRRCGYDLRASPARCPECGAQAWVASP